MKNQIDLRMGRLLRCVAVALFSFAAVASAQTNSPTPTTAMIGSAPEFNSTNSRPSGFARNSPQADKTEDPETIAQQASCVVQIDSSQAYPWSNNGYVAPQAQFAVALVTSTGIIDTATDLLHISQEQRRLQVHVHAAVVGAQLFRLEVDLLKGDAAFPPNAAQMLISNLTDQLTRAFAQSAQAHRKIVASQVNENTKELAALQKQVDDLHTKLSADQTQTSNIGNIYGDIASTLTNARNNQQSAQAELDRSRARMAAIEPALNSDLVTQWEALVKQDQQNVQELTARTTPGATDPKLKDAQDKLADAQNHLDLARQQSEISPQNNQAYRRQEIINLKSTIADQESHLKQANETVTKLSDPNLQKALDEQRALQSQQQILQNRMDALQTMINQTPAVSDTSPAVTLTVLDGKAN